MAHSKDVLLVILSGLWKGDWTASGMREGEELAGLRFLPVLPEVEAGLLKTLGPLPFWKGREPPEVGPGRHLPAHKPPGAGRMARR